MQTLNIQDHPHMPKCHKPDRQIWHNLSNHFQVNRDTALIACLTPAFGHLPYSGSAPNEQSSYWQFITCHYQKGEHSVLWATDNPDGNMKNFWRTDWYCNRKSGPRDKTMPAAGAPGPISNSGLQPVRFSLVVAIKNWAEQLPSHQIPDIESSR